MTDWGYAQTHPKEQLARLHFFSMRKIEAGGEANLTITVKEFFTPEERALAFFAQADLQTNQGLAPYTPSGWGQTLLEALEACVREVNRFPLKGGGTSLR